MDKQLYIISGCNGAGKTTASYTVLPEILDCREFVNADEIARGLSPFNPRNVTVEAGRLMLQRINELLAKEETFAVETTLTTKSYVKLVRQAQQKGYTVTLVYFWLRNPELALQRVSERVANGGHDYQAPLFRGDKESVQSVRPHSGLLGGVRQQRHAALADSAWRPSGAHHHNKRRIVQSIKSICQIKK